MMCDGSNTIFFIYLRRRYMKNIVHCAQTQSRTHCTMRTAQHLKVFSLVFVRYSLLYALHYIQRFASCRKLGMMKQTRCQQPKYSVRRTRRRSSRRRGWPNGRQNQLNNRNNEPTLLMGQFIPLQWTLHLVLVTQPIHTTSKPSNLHSLEPQ